MLDGFPGSPLWIDPVSGLSVILRSSRVHLNGGGDAKPLRDKVAALLGEGLGPLSGTDIAAARPALAGYLAAYNRSRVETGLDVLAGTVRQSVHRTANRSH